MYFIFSLVALLCWSGSDLFSKLGSSQKNKNSHWHVIFAVGVIMGIHAVITLICSTFINDVDSIPQWLASIIYTDFQPLDFVKYAPIAFIYLAAMVIGYVGLRYIELSVSSPICNSSGSLALLICIILGWTAVSFTDPAGIINIVGIVLITAGIITLGIVEYREDDAVKLARQDKSSFKYSKSLIAILIPIIYLFLDAMGTVGDQLVSELELFDMSEYASNTAFEFTSLCFAIFAFILVKFIKKEKFFKLDEDGTTDKTLKKNLILGGLCETVGQIFYMSVMFSDFKAGMPMISAYCVLSVLWSRIFLKEKLSLKHYVTIFVTIAGILLLGIAEVL